MANRDFEKLASCHVLLTAREATKCPAPRHVTYFERQRSFTRFEVIVKDLGHALTQSHR